MLYVCVCGGKERGSYQVLVVTPMQVRALSNMESDCRSLQSALSALEAELGTELLSQLSTEDQKEVRYFF